MVGFAGQNPTKFLPISESRANLSESLIRVERVGDEFNQVGLAAVRGS
jgi:hypothetical protein